MNDYTQSQWQRYQRSRNPEFLWRIASYLNWLTPQEEQSTCGRDFSVDRVNELESQIKKSMETETSHSLTECDISHIEPITS